jgi:hypothetical protein
MIKLLLASTVMLGVSMAQPAFADYYEQATVYTQPVPVTYYSTPAYYPVRHEGYSYGYEQVRYPDYYGRDWHHGWHRGWDRGWGRGYDHDHGWHRGWEHDHG